MNPPELTRDEARLAVLAEHDILDTPPEPGFDDIVRLASLICETPVSLVSLVAGDRQWFKARVGFEPCGTDLGSSVCAHALAEPDLLVIPDLSADARSRDNPLVTGEPYIRFYAGAPLRTAEGHVLGSLCVIDGKPRPEGLTDRQADALRTLGRQVMSQMELRRALGERDALVRSGLEAVERRNALLELGDRLRDLDDIDEVVQVASELVARTLGVTRAGFGYLDGGLEHIDIVSDWSAEGVSSIVGRHRFTDYGDLLGGAPESDELLVISDARTDPRTAATYERMEKIAVSAMVNVPVRDHGRVVALLIVHDREPREWTPEALTFLRNVADRIQAGVARVRAENERAVLNQELSHRMKNMMAMIQAIAIQTLKSVPDRGPVEAFTKRLHALSAAHDVLLAESWTAARLDVLTDTVLETFATRSRVAISGPEIDLGPRAALSLSLLLHEMGTNAVKHGALSAEGGLVSVVWRLEGEGDAREIVLDWRESGGPATHEPAGRGFGSRLIHMGLVGTGGVLLRYSPTGLEAEFRAPLEQVRNS
ncbi:sensor histidine kinase [Hansschlegelia quercus]|uniref:sensor histidine kinase n=1 Tax=Hansschlegelia quercus TaxID=2528245 RepID=UPI001FDECDF3|nr:GAF domain-containing protein [Hansschlegelia quercus]